MISWLNRWDWPFVSILSIVVLWVPSLLHAQDLNNGSGTNLTPLGNPTTLTDPQRLSGSIKPVINSSFSYNGNNNGNTVPPPSLLSSNTGIVDLPVPNQLSGSVSGDRSVNPGLNPEYGIVPPTNHWVFYGDLLLWKAYRQGLSYGVLNNSSNSIPNGEVTSLQLPLTAGFRIGSQYLGGDHQEYLIDFNYTYYRSGTNDYTIAPQNGAILPTLTRPGIIDTVNQGAANANLVYQNFDLNFGRKFQIDQSFGLTMMGGLKFASISQDLQAYYNGGDANSASVNSNTSFYGTGPTIGTQADWRIFRGLSAYGRIQGGLIVGNVQSGIVEWNNNGSTLDGDIQDRSIHVVPVVSMAFGANYQFGNFFGGIGYEMTQWFNLIQQPNPVNDFAVGKFSVRRSDLTLLGVNFRFGFMF